MGPGLVRGVTLAVLAVLALALVWAALRRTKPLEHGRLLEHVEELRRRALLVVAVLVAGTLLALTVRVEERGGWPVPEPALFATMAGQLFAAAADALLPPEVQLITTAPTDAF